VKFFKRWGFWFGMKFGVKTEFDAGFADYFKDKVDFLEVTAVIGKDYSFLDNYPLPVVVHAMASRFGVNFAEKNLTKKNMEVVDFAIEVADRCGAEKIIVHPGRLSNKGCSIEQVVEFFEGLDERIILENQTFRVCKGLCVRPDEMREFVLKTGREFCFDANHAMEVACEDGVDYFGRIEEFIELGPVHYHLGGGIVGDKDREHLNFKDSDFSVERILKMFPDDAWVTIETTYDIYGVEAVEEDLDFLREVANDFGS